nr:degenerin mec-4-like [Penaeus vannamei]
MAFNVDPEALRKVYEQTVGDSYPGFQRARHVLERQLDTKELWDSTAWNISAMVEKCYQGRGLFCSEVGQFRLTYTIFGPCITYAGRPATLAGSYHGLYLRLRAENRTGVAEAGGARTSPAGWSCTRRGRPKPPNQTHGYFVAFKWNKEIIVSLKHFEALDTHRKPCNDDPAYRSSQCITQCFSRSFIKVLRCRLPFMSGDVPYCRGVKMSERVSKHLDVMLLQGAWQPSRCNCATPCKQTIYEYRGDTTDDRNDSNGRVKVFFLDLMYEQVKEEFSYPFASLVADFGGMMGLLLGASCTGEVALSTRFYVSLFAVLTLVEVMEFVINYLLRVYHKRKATQETRRALTYTEVSTLDTLKGFGEVFLPRPAFLTASGQGRSLPCVDCDGASARPHRSRAPN